MFPTLKRAVLPVGITAAVAATVGLGPSLLADTRPELPRVSPEQLIAKVRQANVDGMSGTVRATSDLGLPELPSGSAGAAPLDLLSGTHTLRVAYASPHKAHVAVLDEMAQRTFVRNGRDAYAYDSANKKVTHWRLPAATEGRQPDHRPSGAATLTPRQFAQRVLDKVEPTTKVSVAGTQQVAGRDAYTLRLAPRSTESLVGAVSIGVDAKTGMPLRVAVAPRGGGEPAIDVSFTDVSFDKPKAQRFEFTPPPGATVEQREVPRPGSDSADAKKHRNHRVIGDGWTSVLELRDVPLPTKGKQEGRQGQDGSRDGQQLVTTLLQAAEPVSGPYGQGRLLSTRLVSVLLTDDGRLYAGAVTPEALQQAAASS